MTMVEWKCLMVKDLDQLATPEVNLPGDKLWEMRKKLKETKSQLEKCLFFYDDLAINYAAVLASIRDDGPGLGALMDVALDMDRTPEVPANATNIEEYKKMCKTFSKVWRIRIDQPVQGDVDEYQDGKDLQRDSMVLNGEFISGAEYGYARIVEAVTCWSENENNAKRILQALNRTTSGGTAFDHVLRSFGNFELVNISPASKEAKPLAVAVSNKASIGCAHTQYLVYEQENNEKIAEIDAYFTFRMTGDQMQSSFLFLDLRYVAAEAVAEVAPRDRARTTIPHVL